MLEESLYDLSEEIIKKNYVIASYYIELYKDDDIIRKSEKLAFGQTVGTWVDVPGIDSEMLNKHVGKIINIIEIPPYELISQIENDKRRYLLEIAFPTVNFGNQFAMMLATLLGNDASTSAQVKLVDLKFPTSYIKSFKGPKFGITGIRDLVKVYNRPLLLNMIKPCTGITPEKGAKIFYETALGGIDFIKDDELLGNTKFSPVKQRVKAYKDAADQAYKKTGKKVIYICNVTDAPDKIIQTVSEAIDAKVEAIMMSFSVVGYDMFKYISDHVDVPVLGHYAMSGSYNEGINNGISSCLSIGKLPRLAGADMVMINNPYSAYQLVKTQYYKTAANLKLPFLNVLPSMPVLGGGVHPGMISKLISDFGKDIVIAAGGSIQGHPISSASGVIAMFQAIEAAMNNIDIADYMKDKDELKTAIDKFGK